MGFLFLLLYPGPPLPRFPLASFRHLSRTTLSHTTCHTQHHFSHAIFVTPSFAHTTLSHTIFHTQLCHTPSFTHHLCQPSLSHTIFVNHLRFTRHTRSRRGTWHWAGSGGALGPVLVAGDAAAFCVASVANGDIHLRFTGQAWHLATTTFVLRGRRGTYGTGLALVARLGPFWSSVTRHFAWQAWHLGTSTFVSRGRLRDNHLRFAWQAWHLWHWAGSGGALRPILVVGDAALCVAGVALGDVHLRVTWQASRQPPSFCVAGVALMALGWLWWRAWARFGRR